MCVGLPITELPLHLGKIHKLPITPHLQGLQSKDCMPSERLESQCSNRAGNEATSYCDACKESKPSQDFDRNILHHAKYNSRRRVCLGCAADGYSPRDTQAYPCAECGLRGHLKFSSQKLKDYKCQERRATLICKDCVARHNDIRTRLEEKHSWRCSCPGKIHNPGMVRDRMGLPKNQKCILHQDVIRKDRWAGKNKGVSLEDLQFFERLAKQQRR